MTKRRGMSILFVLFFTVSMLYSSTNINNFSASVINGKIKLKWNSSVESNVKSFLIEKSSDDISFQLFNNIQPKGSNSSYIIIDNNPYDKGNSVIYYRIVVEDNDGSKVYSNSEAVEIMSSGFNATWGSIKAMFR